MLTPEVPVIVVVVVLDHSIVPPEFIVVTLSETDILVVASASLNNTDPFVPEADPPA